jgi:transcriptional regulator
MYNPPHFTTTDLTWLDWLAENYPFGTLISMSEGAPLASHLPVLCARNNAQVVLTGHWARPNPQWRDIESQRVMFIFHGPHAYISPRWYADSQKQVPTWNYVTAHVYGKVRVIHDGVELERIVTALSSKFESRDVPDAWTFAKTDPANLSRLRGIVGFTLHSDSVQIKLKLNQPHTAANLAGAITGLRSTSSQEAAAVADLMQGVLDKK